jgi:hypothetical protein
MPYCSPQSARARDRLVTLVLPAKLCQGVDTRRFVAETFCLSCMVSAAAAEQDRLFLGHLAVQR